MWKYIATIAVATMLLAGCSSDGPVDADKVEGIVTKELSEKEQVDAHSSCRMVYADHFTCTVRYDNDAGIAKTAKVYVACDPKPCAWKEF